MFKFLYFIYVCFLEIQKLFFRFEIKFRIVNQKHKNLAIWTQLEEPVKQPTERAKRV